MEGKAAPLPQAYYIWKSIDEGLWILGAVFNFSFVFVCVVSFKNPNTTPFKFPYFVLVAVSTALRIFTSIERLGKTFWKAPYPQWYLNIYELWAIYSNQFHGIASVALAANRATAFIFPLEQDKIWRWRNFFIILVFMALFPLITHLWCIDIIYAYWATEEEMKIDYSFAKDMIRTHKYVHFINFLTPVIALILNIISIIKIHFTTKNISATNNANIEAKLLYQSIFSPLTFFLWNLLILAAYHMSPIILEIEAQKDYEFRDQLLLIRNCIGEVGNLISIAYFEGGLILLLKFSKPVRDYYFKFYKINFMFHKIKNVRNGQTHSSVHVMF